MQQCTTAAVRPLAAPSWLPAACRKKLRYFCGCHDSRGPQGLRRPAQWQATTTSCDHGCMAPICVRTVAVTGVSMPETSATRGGMLHVSRSTHETKPAAAGRHSLARRADKDRALSKCFTIYTNLHATHYNTPRRREVCSQPGRRLPSPMPGRGPNMRIQVAHAAMCCRAAITQPRAVMIKSCNTASTLPR